MGQRGASLTCPSAAVSVSGMVANANPPTVPRRFPPRDPDKPRQKRLNTELGGVLLAQGLSFDEIAQRIGSASGNAVRVALARKGITKRSARDAAPTPERTASVTLTVVSQAESILRERLNGGLLQATDALLSKPPTRKSLANRGQGHAAVLEGLSRTWRNLNGSPDSVTLQFGANMLSDLAPIPQPVVSSMPSVDVSELPIAQPVEPAPIA